MKHYEIGQKVRVSPENDNECYAMFRDKELLITRVSENSDQHPGFDSSMKGDALYDLKTTAGEDIPFSLYGDELIRVY